LADYRGVDARMVTRPPNQPRARRPGATDARRASLGGGALGERIGRPHRRACALAVRGVGGSPWLALAPVLLTGSVATANWLQPAGMATHCANVLISAVSGNPDSLADGPTLFTSSSGGCGDRPEFIRGCHKGGLARPLLMQGLQRARPINREHAGQAPRTPGGPALVATLLTSTVGVHTVGLTRSRFEVWAGHRGWRKRRCRPPLLWQPRIGFSPPVWPPTAPASW